MYVEQNIAHKIYTTSRIAAKPLLGNISRVGSCQ